MGCQKTIVEKIVEAKADYLIAVKDNQAKLHAAIANEFELGVPSLARAQSLDFHATEETGHGRHATQRCWTLTDLPQFLNATTGSSSPQSFSSRPSARSTTRRPFIGAITLAP
jgi:predicted transposase YbfD/YdcC